LLDNVAYTSGMASGQFFQIVSFWGTPLNPENWPVNEKQVCCFVQ